jgi:hypothetical protein
LTITVSGSSRTIAKKLESLSFSRPEAPGTPPEGMGSTINYDEGWAARMDIAMSGTRKIPGSGEIATHSETVSVFMIEEYYKLINKNRFLSMSQLAKDDGAKVLDANFDLDSMFQSELDPEELAKLNQTQLENLKIKEENGLTEAQTRLDEIDDSIKGVDTKGNRTWYTLWIGKADTEVTDIQDDLKKHDKVTDLEKDIEKLDVLINRYEKDNLKDSFKTANIDIDNMDKESQDYKDLKDAYDLKLRDRSMREAYDAGKKEGDAEYTSMIDSYNPANMTKGVVKDSEGNDVTFTESDDEFEIRRAKAETIFNNCQKVDLGWMDYKSG